MVATYLGEMVILVFAPHELARVLELGLKNVFGLALDFRRPVHAEYPRTRL